MKNKRPLSAYWFPSHKILLHILMEFHKTVTI